MTNTTSGVVWLTGVSGAGKSTIASHLHQQVRELGVNCFVLDGDQLRLGLNRDLAYSDEGRKENVRRVAEVSRLMSDAGVLVIVALISPFTEGRRFARSLFATGKFCEVFVDTPLAVAEERDPKGLYAKARKGDIANFTGIDSTYEAPTNPELRVETTLHSPADSAALILETVRSMGLLDR
jgi:bifunctional enzyme CysN/CysC